MLRIKDSNRAGKNIFDLLSYDVQNGLTRSVTQICGFLLQIRDTIFIYLADLSHNYEYDFYVLYHFPVTTTIYFLYSEVYLIHVEKKVYKKEIRYMKPDE